MSAVRVYNAKNNQAKLFKLKTVRIWSVECDSKTVKGQVECSHEIPIDSEGRLELESSVCVAFKEERSY
jgi:hypothetical protein